MKSSLVDLGPADADITDPDTYVAGVPHATFQRLRDDDPVSWWPEHDGGKGFWAITRYDDLLHVSRNVDMFSSAQGITLEEMDLDDFEARRNMLEYDPPAAHPLSPPGVEAVQPTRGATPTRTAIRLLARAVVDEALAVRHGVRLRRTNRQAAADAHARHACWACPSRMAIGWSNAATRCSATSIRSSPSIPSASTDTEEFKSIPFRSPAALDLYRYAERQAEQTTRPPDRRRDQRHPGSDDRR